VIVASVLPVLSCVYLGALVESFRAPLADSSSALVVDRFSAAFVDAVVGFGSSAAVAATAEKFPVFKGDDKFQQIKEKAKTENWSALPIGELMGKIATELEGTPYVGGTLELSADQEVCSVNLDELDCVTFFESTLNLARMLKNGESTSGDLLKEVQHTRYRGGIVGDYSSRLHYTSDWLFDNEKKGVVRVLNDLPGAVPFTQKVGFMSTHAGSYKQLAAHPKLVEKMKRQEKTINSRKFLKFIPADKVASVEPLLKTGDIVGLCTSVAGLDISHTGIVYRTADGVAHFMDASSKKANMKVTIEPGAISQAVKDRKNFTGVVFARPLEPGGKD
jgi:Protein of unknown function (DUF1460).